ncbi:MAG: response regulator [Planctomycetes bacterium]|nr:response regulator [Planctomycetota bacterium]
MAQSETILLVDDDPVFRERLSRAMERRGLRVLDARDRATAREAAQSSPPQLAVVDLRMPSTSGIDVVRDLIALRPEIRVVVLTGFGSIASALEAMRAGAVDYLTKPADADQILAALRGERAQEEPAPSSVPSLERVEWEHIQRVLSECEGNISQAARALGIHRRTLQRKLANHPPSR